MAKIPINEISFQEYLKRNNWSCPNSPHNGHYWVVREGQTFVCKYCGEIKDMPIPSPENHFYVGRGNRGFKKRGN